MRALPEGTRVRHTRLGFGEVVESNSERTLINFEVHGFMRFNTFYLTIQVVQMGPTTNRSQAG